MAESKVRLMTADELQQLPRGMGERYELVEGELIVMTPAKLPHGHVAHNAGVLLGIFNKEHKLGRLFAAETGFYTRGDDKTIRAPDVSFVSFEKLPRGKLPDSFGRAPPDLVIEVVSPTDYASAIEEKVQEWLDFGVREVWVFYPKTRRIFVHRPNRDIRKLSADDTLEGGDVLPGFSARVAEFFED